MRPLTRIRRIAADRQLWNTTELWTLQRYGHWDECWACRLAFPTLRERIRRSGLLKKEGFHISCSAGRVRHAHRRKLIRPRRPVLYAICCALFPRRV